MIKYLPLLCLIVTAGCAPGLDDPRYVKECEVPYYAGLYAEYDIDCEWAVSVIELSRHLHGVTRTIPLNEYDHTLKGVPLRVMATAAFEVTGRVYGGVYNPWNGLGIQVGDDMRSLFHEEMHVWEGRHADVTTPLHVGWEKPGKSYAAASSVFVRVLTNQNISRINGEMSEEMAQALRDHGFGWYLEN